MWSFFKDKFQHFYNQLTSKLKSIFTGERLEEAQWDQLFELLIGWQVGVPTAQDLVKVLKSKAADGLVKTPEQALSVMREHLLQILISLPKVDPLPEVIVLVGVNGAGKTSCLAKLAALCKQQNRKTLLIAGDTFRAAAGEQLELWANRIGVDIYFSKNPDQDAATVIFDGCKQFSQGGYDHLLIDTAGRLHTKVNLVKELERLGKSISRNCQGRSVGTWLVLDAMLGQSSVQQAEIFLQAVKVDGLILTKLDGGGKGGVVFAIARRFNLPVLYLSYGENSDQLKAFDAQDFIDQLFS